MCICEGAKSFTEVLDEPTYVLLGVLSHARAEEEERSGEAQRRGEAGLKGRLVHFVAEMKLFKHLKEISTV